MNHYKDYNFIEYLYFIEEFDVKTKNHIKYLISSRKDHGDDDILIILKLEFIDKDMFIVSIPWTRNNIRFQ